MQNYTAAQLQYIVERALAEKRLTPTAITGYLRQLDEEIRDLEQRLQLLRGAASARVPLAAKGSKTRQDAMERPKPALPRPKRAARASAKNTSSQKLQGQYIGFLRQLPLRDRPKYQELARKHGREQAIAAIRKVLGK